MLFVFSFNCAQNDIQLINSFLLLLLITQQVIKIKPVVIKKT